MRVGQHPVHGPSCVRGSKAEQATKNSSPCVIQVYCVFEPAKLITAERVDTTVEVWVVVPGTAREYAQRCATNQLSVRRGADYMPFALLPCVLSSAGVASFWLTEK